MRKAVPLAVLFIFVFVMPVALPNTDFASLPENLPPLRQVTEKYAEAGDYSTGYGSALDVVRTGTALADKTSLTFDSSAPGVTSVTLTDGWTGTNLAADLQGLTATFEDVLENGNLDAYHSEKFVVSSSTSRNSASVSVPDGWTFIKDVPADDPHPLYGTYRVRSDSFGYSGRSAYFYASWGTGGWTHSADDEICISQMVPLPWREVYSADITFKYRVSGSSTMDNGVHLFLEIGSNYQKFFVFESGDPVNTWLTASVSIPASSMQNLDDYVTQFMIGMATDLTGTSTAGGYYAYVDDVVVDFTVRPFPEQIDLRANGTAVIGTEKNSIYPYLPDDANRDCYDQPGGAGIDLDGYNNDGRIEVGIWDSSAFTTSGLFELGLQFPVDIPQGAVITRAWLEMEAVSSSSTPLYAMRLHMADEDTVAAFTNGLPTLEDRFSWLPTSVNWPLNSWIASPQTRYRSPEIAPLLQNVISRSNWGAGNYICIMARLSNADSYQRWVNIKGSAGEFFEQTELARLFVEYVIPLPEDTVMSYEYEKDITIDHTKVDADLTDFPVLIDLWDADLRTHVRSDGSDIAFVIGDQGLFHEIEMFDKGGNGTHAHLVAWVKVPTLYSSVDTVITMRYGSQYAIAPGSTQVWSDYAIVQHMNDDPSSIQYDSTSNNHDGTSYGGMSSSNLVSGQMGYAVDFDGSDDVISVGQIDTDEWTGFTMSAWIYRTQDKDARVFSKSTTTDPNTHIMTLRLDDYNRVTTRLRTDGTANGVSITSSAAASSLTWHHLAWSWSASRGSIMAYLDGVLVIESSYGGTSIYDSDAMFVIGNNDLLNPRWWAGRIDEVRLTTFVRSETWILTEYNNQDNPDSFYSIGSQRSIQNTWSDAGRTSLEFTTTSPSPVTMEVLVTMDISGVGQTLNSDFNPGTDYFVESGSTIVNWTGQVMVSPPAGATNMGFTVEYPVGEWKPTKVLNPYGQAKALGTDWWYSGGYLTISSDSIDFWGLWTVKFISMNYVENLQLGIAGQALADTATFNVGDEAKFLAPTPTYLGGTVGFVLSDPSGGVWFQGSNTTTSNPSHKFPSFRYHKDLVIGDAVIYDNLVNFPVLVDFTDVDLHNPSKVKADGSDIMFAMGSTVLPHEIEYFKQDYTLNEARIVAWVLANLTDGTANTITMYYGSDLLDNLENPEAIWAASGYEAVYHLGEEVVNEASGAVHYDSSGNDHHGTQYGNDDQGGRAGFGQEFDGTNDQILLPDTLSPEGDLIISGWFRLSSLFNGSSPTSYLIMTKYLSNDVNMHIGLVGLDYGQSVPYGRLVFKVESVASAVMYKWTTVNSWLAGWHHFVCVVDSSNPSDNKIFINGYDRTDSGSTGSASWADLAFVADWGLGGGSADSQFPGGQGWFPGRLDEIRIATTPTRSAGWVLTEYRNQVSASSFAVPTTEVERTSPDLSIKKTVDSSAPAGEWTVSAYYNDSGSYVTNKTGLFERTFIVKHDSTLTLNKPTDAVGDRITVKTAGDAVILEYELKDAITSAGVTGATVTINWTSPSTITLDDYGGGRYGAVLDTNDLADAQRWRVEVDTSHPYFNDASEYFFIDLFHGTRLDYTDASTTPVGLDFTATLKFTDTYTSTPIEGATITFGDDSPVNVVSEGGGLYYISVDTTGLSLGSHVFTLKATKSESYMNTATVDVTVTVRAHFTAVSVSGSMTQPHGTDLPLHVVLLDLDTGTIIDIGSVDHFNFTSSQGEEIKQSLFTYDMTLPTNTWDIGAYTVTLRVVISNSNYYQPDDYQFDVTIRKHRTSVSVSGVVVQPYGNTTPLTVIITDLDTGTTIGFGDVNTLTFTWPPSGSQIESSLTSLDVILDTSTWNVNSYTVTLAVSMSNTIYQNPSNHVFTVTIRSMSVMMYHDPASLVFPNGNDFIVNLRLNISEEGIYYGDPITDRIAGEFAVTGYVISIDTSDQAVGRYGLTIAASYFGDGYYEITVRFISNDARYEDASLKIRFRYRPIIAFLSSPNFPQVTTPYLLDVEILLNYTDYDTGTGIDGATITSPDHPEWIASWTDSGSGVYSVWIDVSSLPRGTYYLNLTADKASYEAKTLEFRVVVREAYTSAIPSVGSLSIPIGNSPVFYVDFTDIDRLIPIDNATSPYTQVVSDWGNFSVVYLAGTQEYQITFHTSLSDTIAQNQVYYFTFSKGSNYKSSTFTVSVSIRTHNTDFRLVSSIEPVSTIGTFVISVYYGDLDSAVGIRSGLVDLYVHNVSGLVVSSFNYDDASGDGFYLIYVDANQFGLGLQSFTVYADWTGAVAVYHDKNFVTSASVVGRESALTLLISSDPTPYGEEMSYVFFFSDSGVGISNLTGDVFVYVAFPTEAVDLGKITIADLSASQPGNYSISFNTNMFDRIGLIFMNVYVNWSKGVAPYYSNRTDTISVRVLSRDTLLSISPPSSTSWNQTAEFTFTWEDLIAGAGTLIGADPSLTIEMSVAFTYSESAGTFTIYIDTTQFSSLGSKAMTFSVKWAGAPFYANRTGRTVYLTVLARETSLDYLAPAPTQYLDEVVFNVTWTDVTEGSSAGIGGATLELYLGASPVDPAKYSWFEISQGVYEVTLNTTFVASPGTYSLRVQLSIGLFYILDVSALRDFNVRTRITLLSAEPISRIPHNASMEIILYYQDLFTSDVIANETAYGYPVSLEILTAPPGGAWYYTCEWQPTFGYYVLTIETWNQGYNIDVFYIIQLRMSYTAQSPYYASDDLVVAFRFRARSTTLRVESAPETTPFGFDASFTVQYIDNDESGAGVDGATIYIEYESSPLTEGVHYSLSRISGGYYSIILDTDILSGLGSHVVKVSASWTGVPYYVTADRDVTVTLRERETAIEITVPPSQVKYLDDIVFTFVYTDLDVGSPITAITQANVLLYFTNGTQIVGGYTVTPSGSAYVVSIPSTLVTSSPQTGLELVLAVDWPSGTAPYYADDDTILRFSVVRRTMFVEPSQIDRTPKGDILTITVTVTDTDTANLVPGAIIVFSCQNDTLVLGTSYWIDELSGVYTITVDTDWLTSGIGTYLFDIRVQWDPLLSPFYANKTVITLSGLIDEIWTSLQSGAPNPSTAQIGQIVWLLVSYRDLDHDQIGINSATINVRYADLSVPLDLSRVEVSPGVYNVSFSTADRAVGSHQITISALRSGYATASLTTSFGVTLISTALEAVEAVITLNWTADAYVVVNFENLLFGGFVSGASVTWSSSGGFEGALLEIGSTGSYQAYIDTEDLGAGTRVFVVTAQKDNYVTSVTTITLVIVSLPSQIFPAEPLEAVKTIDRGGPVTIQVYLYDSYNGMNISELQVIPGGIYISFEGQTTPLSYNAASGLWEGAIPGAWTILTPASYDVRIIAGFYNYDASSYSFKLLIQQTATSLAVVGASQIDAVYSEVVGFTLNFTAPRVSELIDNGNVVWFQGNWTNDVNFTYIGSGIWTLSFNTTSGEYGTWGLVFRGEPSDPIYATTTVTVTLTISRIDTEVITPVISPEKIWGWQGNVTVFFNDTSFVKGIVGASVTYSYGYGDLGNINFYATDLGNGSYSVYIDTTLLAPNPNTRYTILVTFLKPNYVTRTAGIQLLVLERPTAMVVYVNEQNQFEGNPLNLMLPMGDSLNITVLYNDTSPVGGFSGGIENASIPIGEQDTSFTGPSFPGYFNLTLIPLGNGYYHFMFDSMDPSLYVYDEGVPTIYDRHYYFTIKMYAEHRELRTIVISLRVVTVPTEVVFGDPDLLEFELINAEQMDFEFYVGDTWHGTPVEGVTFTTTRGASAIVVPGSNISLGDGWYRITIRAVSAGGDSVIRITLSKDYHEDVTFVITVRALPNDVDILVTQFTTIGLPIMLVAFTLLGLYVKVWSVPKRIRQINGQIKALRKGKLPKAVPDVKSRQALIAGLFNDTYAKTEIKRTAEQMPEESIPIEVPELGELLVQLAILTNLNAEELEEFKADISKMKISEQAAFVKEVITQESIRAARRDGKTVEETLEAVEKAAQRRLGGEEEVGEAEEAARVERVFLTPEEAEDVTPEVEPERAAHEEKPEVAEETAERMSPHEIEELRRELERKGVPPYEIDTIIAQARTLPRDLVEELVRSLETGEE